MYVATYYDPTIGNWRRIHESNDYDLLAYVLADKAVQQGYICEEEKEEFYSAFSNPNYNSPLNCPYEIMPIEVFFESFEFCKEKHN